MAAKSFRVGIIGSGLMARVRAEVLGQLPGVVVAGICGRSVERAMPVAHDLQVEAWGDWERFVKEELDGIVVTTPNYLHARQAIAALQHSKHVFCEYPLATNSRDLQSMFETADLSRKVLGAGFDSLFTMQQIAERTRDLSRPTLACHDGLWGRDENVKWYLDESMAGGMIVLWGIEQIASLCLVFDRVRSVAAFGTKTFSSPDDTEDTFTILLDFENGATGCVQTGINSPTQFRTFRVVCERGSIEMRGHEEPVVHEEGKEPFRLGLQQPLGKNADTLNWVKACLGDADPFPDQDQVLHFHQVAFAARESARTGKVVML